MDLNVLPEHCLGADLLWWRTAHGLRTTIALFWARYYEFPELIHLEARLFDNNGKLIASWRLDIDPHQPLYIDSAAEGPWREYQGTDGILALYVCTENEPGLDAVNRYSRLFPYIDWHRPDGLNAGLHSDQIIKRGRHTLDKITEIVVIESDTETNALVVLNGEVAQANGALSLSFKNTLGEERSCEFQGEMPPFTVQHIPFRDIFPDVASFGAGKPLLVSGSFFAHGLFSRPLVETTGQRWGVFHSGNVYQWDAKPHFMHALITGEVNPMAVIHDANLQTFVNLLHSHDGFEQDVSVDVKLYDEPGDIVFSKTAWRIVPRHGLVRFNISDLLEDARKDFQGHIALSFTVEPGQSVPFHLQALLEYRHINSVAHVMAWSDEWNSKLQLAKRDRLLNRVTKKAYSRVHVNDALETQLAITNAGHEGYTRDASVAITLLGKHGESDAAVIILAPYASCFSDVSQLFPDARRILGTSGFGLVIIESESELAAVAFTRLRSTGAVAAEHFLPMESKYENAIVLPSGN